MHGGRRSPPGRGLWTKPPGPFLCRCCGNAVFTRFTVSQFSGTAWSRWVTRMAVVCLVIQEIASLCSGAGAPPSLSPAVGVARLLRVVTGLGWGLGLFLAIWIQCRGSVRRSNLHFASDAGRLSACPLCRRLILFGQRGASSCPSPGSRWAFPPAAASWRVLARSGRCPHAAPALQVLLPVCSARRAGPFRRCPQAGRLGPW